MRSEHWKLLFAVVETAALLPILSSCDGGSGPGRHDSFYSDEEWDVIRTLSPVPELPPSPTNSVADSAAAASLGQAFFFDARFSGPLQIAENEITENGGNGSPGDVEQISCSRCHDPSTSFVDQRSVPATTSLASRRTGRHTPTALNAAYNEFQFWDGRKDSLWSQALGPIESPAEHNFNRIAVVQLIFDKYRADYESIFGAMPDFSDASRFPQVPNPPDFVGQGRPGDGAGSSGLDAYDEMTAGDKALVDAAFANFGKSIEAYERLLVSRDSSFDRFVADDDDAITVSARRGLKLFIGRAFCINCHSGPNFTDGEFHNVGLAQQGSFIPLSDVGRYGGVPAVLSDAFNGAGAFSDDPIQGAARLADLAQDDSQLGQFKTPTLRSIPQTQPYFHTGSAASLRDVVDFYNRGGDGNGFAGTAAAEMIPLGLSDDELNDIAEFLETLAGADLSPALTTTPVLPP